MLRGAIPVGPVVIAGIAGRRIWFGGPNVPKRAIVNAIVSKNRQMWGFSGDNFMTARSIGKFLPSLKLRLGTKAVICAILLIAINTALVVGAAHWSLTNEFGDRALRDIEVNLRTLGLAFAETYSDAKITMKDGAVVRA